MLFEDLFGKNKNENTDETQQPEANKVPEIPDEKTREQFLRNLQKAYKKYTEQRAAASDNDTVETIVHKNIQFTIKNGTILTNVLCPEGTSAITVPDSITEIAAGVFQQMQEIREVILPEGLDKIGDRAFLMCTALEEIVLPPTVTHIGIDTFKDCQNLRSISIPVGIRCIGRNALKCMGKVFFYSDKGSAQIYPYCEGDKRTDDIVSRILLMKKGNYDHPCLSYGSMPMPEYAAFEEALKLASSYYIITEDRTALNFLLSNMEDLILSIQDNTDMLLKKLMDQDLIDTETLLRFIKIILRNKKSKSEPEFRVLSVILDHMKNRKNIGLYEYSQLELVKYIRFICPVPWETVYFRIVAENDMLRFHYCYIEKDTGFVTAMSTEEKRYGYILDYRRPADIAEILHDRCRTFYALDREKNSDHLWKSAAFIVEHGAYTIAFEYESVLADEAWENACTGGISQDFSAEYPVQKLQEESEEQMGIVHIPTDPQTRSAMTIQEYYVLLQKCCEYLGDDYMKMYPPAAPEQIAEYKKGFSAEPDNAFIEWLSMCNGLTMNDWAIYDINSPIRSGRNIDSGYSHIARNICCGYGISYETGKCCKFDHDFGDEECEFTDILDLILDDVHDCMSEVESEREEAYLMKNHRALSDSYAAFLVRYNGADSMKSHAEKARIRQAEEQEKRYYYYYDDIEIVKEYQKYITKVCGGEGIL